MNTQAVMFRGNSKHVPESPARSIQPQTRKRTFMKTHLTLATLALGITLAAGAAFAADTMAPSNTMAPASTMAPANSMGSKNAMGTKDAMATKPIKHKKKKMDTMVPAANTMAPANSMGGVHALNAALPCDVKRIVRRDDLNFRPVFHSDLF